MAQVARQQFSVTSWDAQTNIPTIGIPAGDAGNSQVLFVTIYNGTQVAAPSIPGWTKQGDATLGTNRFTAYKRALTAAVNAGGEQVTFAQAVEGEAWAATYNGAIGAINVNPDTSWSDTRNVPVVNAQEGNALQVVAGASAQYPRQADTPAGFVEANDRSQYHAQGGLNLHVFERAVGQGDTAAATYQLRERDNDGGAAAGDRTMLANFVIEELAPANVARFNVLAQFPDIAISLTPEQTTITDTVNIQYSATVQGSTQGVTWSVESGPGSIDSNGLYSSAGAGVATIRATSVESTGVFAEATATVKPLEPVLDAITNGQSPITISGTAEPNASVAISITGVNETTTTADGAGDWSISKTLDPGNYEASARQTVAGQTSQFSQPESFTVQQSAPTIDPPELFVISSGPGTRLISGTGIPGATVELIINGSLNQSVTVRPDGDYDISVNLQVGNYVAFTRQNFNGQTSFPSTQRTFNVFSNIETIEPKYGSRSQNDITSQDGDVPDPPVTADQDKIVGKVRAPFKTPKAWPAREIQYPEGKGSKGE